MRYRAQFLNFASEVVRELVADLRSPRDALNLLQPKRWPPEARVLRVTDLEGCHICRTPRRKRPFVDASAALLPYGI